MVLPLKAEATALHWALVGLRKVGRFMTHLRSSCVVPSGTSVAEVWMSRRGKRRGITIVTVAKRGNKLETDLSFVNDLLWTDECTFSRTGLVNRQNTLFWSLQNPHVIRPNNYQV
ncbi:hypothetical protein AVEN_209330-1 [Araneus ventricosus]|uniref:Uncharacterized protein n=1 Tax=Araneus ventricosus TaxID=182803 RepID=A0A4Y2CCD6_ARAVE|nr:hypothetical protein AVEN_209330-1 [Araneus ventricosus]